ncbi:hypothetical protein GCM10010082_15450 [Kushneria pakistanensis]|uniref:Uncharacterized protein n=1 Tax=Kushneria pakistanensis TaxID=1508770 RepID=A0ABQ3FGZ9_9GAMM|nr:hypothetical protein GCM10010082_15450 [Kushneria pakistanensis]
MAKAKAAPIVAVKVAVWVMKPGPTAEVAIRKTAPISEARRDLTNPGSVACAMSGKLHNRICCHV